MPARLSRQGITINWVKNKLGHTISIAGLFVQWFIPSLKRNYRQLEKLEVILGQICR
jgi:hypothetical protein